MMIMESFLLGQPQMVFDATALLAITAWHIFPDILILGATVRQLKHGDPLVQAGGVLAIGSERMPGKEDDMGGAICSLSLAHLRFYGPPHSRVQLSRHEYFQGHIREVHGSGIRKFEYMSAGFGAGNCVLLCSNLGIYYLYNLHRILTSPKSTSIFGPEQSLL
jgi:hypothetical protein